MPSPLPLLVLVAILACLGAAGVQAFRLPSKPTPTTQTSLFAERVTASTPTPGQGGGSSMRSAPSARPQYQHQRGPRHAQNLHGGGGLREINNGINFWGKQRDFDMVVSLVARVEAEGLRPNIYTFHALLNAAVLCHRGEAETRQVWETMTQEHGIKPTAVTYNIFLKRFFGHRSPVAQRQALALLDEMRHEGVEPDVLTFNELINICVEGGDMKAATNLLQAMLHRGLRPDATTYTTLIKGYGLKGNLVSAFDTVKEMRAQAVALTTYSCNVLADACIRCGQPARALKLYRDFEAANSVSAVSSSLDLKSFNIMLKAHREMGQLEGALGTLAAMKARGLEPDFVTYNTLVDAYCKAQKPQGARALVAEMKAGKVPVTHQTLHPLLQEEITSQGASLEQALVLAKEMLEEHGHAPSDVTVCTVMEAMLAMERPGDAIQVFLRSFALGGEEKEEGEKKNKPSLVAYNGLIKAYREYVLGLDLEGETGGDMPPITLLQFFADGTTPTLIEATSPTAILDAILPLPAYLRAAQAGGGGGGGGSSTGPDSITYNVLMDFAAELGQVAALESIHQARSAAGFAMDHYVAHSYMKAHATQGNLAGVTEAKEKMEATRVPPNERTFSVLVLSLLRCGQVDKADLLLKNALSRHLYVHDSLFMAFIQHHMATQPPNLAAAREVFEAFKTRRVPSSSSSSSSSSPPPPPVLLGQQHGKWTVSVWNAWMGALARTGDLPAVLAVWEEMTSPAVGLRPTMSSYAQVVHAACEAKEVETALEWVGRMKARRFMPDIRVYNQLIYACLGATTQEGGGGVKHLSEVLAMMEREGVQPNAITLRAKHSIMRVLASRMRSVSDSFMGKLKMLALSKQLGGLEEEAEER